MYKRQGLLRENDFVSFYVGWVSPEMNINLSNIEAFKTQFKDLREHSTNIAAGVFYVPRIESKWSLNIEAGIASISLSANLLI